MNGQSRGTVLVTGGTDGLGRAAAILLAEHGYRVFAGGRNAERRANLEQLARDRKIALESLELDVCDDASVDHAVREIEKRCGAVEILINNAGIAVAAVIEEISLVDLRKQYETNIFGVVRTTQRVLPHMRQQRRGRIVNMSSIAGKVAIPILGAYGSSKHALEAISDALRLELYPFDVHVVLVEPGIIPTNMSRTAEELSSAYVTRAPLSPYASVYQAFRNSWAKSTKTAPDTPEDCAQVILRSIEDTPPRARYLVTREAKMSAFMRRILPDSIFDNGIKKRLGLEEVRESLMGK